MQVKTKYVLHVSFDALKIAFDKTFNAKLKFYECSWIDTCESMYEHDENYACIEYCGRDDEELNLTTFFQIVCHALPISKHINTGFFIASNVNEKDSLALSIENGFTLKNREKIEYQPLEEFYIDEAIFNAAADEKLRRIEDICSEGKSRC